MAFAASRPSPVTPPTVPPPVVPRLVLLDRDGVVNEDVGAPGVIDPRQLTLTPNAGRAIGRLKRNGCHVSLITNQSCVGKGIISETDLRTIHERLDEMLLKEDSHAVLDNKYICTSTKEDGDRRMKPHPGMLYEARNDFGGETDCSCVFIGDTLTDMMAAKAGGVELRVLVETGYGKGLMGRSAGTIPSHIAGVTHEMDPDLAQVLPFVYAENLSGAVDWLLSCDSLF
jgi:D-glycero-D-manno-heptose 1,7-bisphosphate phosphatase